ncbi:MAG: hypothetical protein HY812_10710 [Planctomycetes bacterium]|nr:hypothetical protein [Planctomycetota bacterium]
MADPQTPDALMAEAGTGEQIRRLLRAARDNRFRIILLGAIGMIVGAGVATIVPDLYESETKLVLREWNLVEETRLLASIQDQPLAVKEDVLREELTSFEWIHDVLEKVEWIEFAEARGDGAKMFDLVNKVRDEAHFDIKMETSSAGELLVELSFRWYDPRMAHDFVLQTRRNWIARRIEESNKFWGKKLQDAEKLFRDKQETYQKATAARQQFMTEHGLSFMDERSADSDLQNALVVRLSEQQARIRELESQTRAQQEQLDATPEKIDTPIKERNPDWDTLNTQLQSERGQLQEMLARYTETHPLVKKQRKRVEEAEAAFAAVKDHEFITDTVRSETNPAWLEIRKALDLATAMLRGYREGQADQEAQLQEVHERLSQQPTLQSELQRLQNEYDVAQEEFNQASSGIMPLRDRMELKKKQGGGTFADAEAELASGGAFSILEEPVVADTPVGLPKPVFLLIGLLLGVAAALAFALVAEMARSTFDDPAEAALALRLPVLGAVGNISTSAERRRARVREVVRMAGSVLIVAVLGVLVYLVTTRPEVLPVQVQDAIEGLRAAFQ